MKVLLCAGQEHHLEDIRAHDNVSVISTLGHLPQKGQSQHRSRRITALHMPCDSILVSELFLH